MKLEVVGDRKCDKCKGYITKDVTTVVLPNGRKRYFHSQCLPPEDMKVIRKTNERGPIPL